MVSTLQGPIPPHPYYDKSDQNQYIDRPLPRVRPEAQDIYNHAQGTVAMILQLEGQRIPTQSRRPKFEPKDHVRENVRRMRQIQRSAKQKEDASAQPVKALWKTGKFEAVGSRIKDDIQREPAAPRPHSANFLRAHSRTGWAPTPRRPSSTEPPEDKLTVPTAESAREVKMVRKDVDFIRANGKAAARFGTLQRSPSLTALDDLKKKQDDQFHRHPRGAVPKYLQKRRQEWHDTEEQRIASTPDPEMPEGHRLMPDNERRETLSKIKQSQTELMSQLQSLPIRTDTLRMRTRKEELERKLMEVEEAIKIFSRPKVFVRLDD